MRGLSLGLSATTGSTLAGLALAGVGDSITYGTNSAASFIEVIADLRGGNAVVGNYGEAGASWDYDWDGAATALIDSVSTQAATLNERALAHKTIAFAGSNGLVLGGHTAAQEYADFEAWLAATIAAGWGAGDIYVCTMLQRSLFNESIRQDYNALLIAGAATHGYNLIRFDQDYFLELINDPVVRAEYSDGIHPTTWVHRLMAQIAYQAMFGAAPDPLVAWCDVDAHASEFTLSNSNRTITRDGSGAYYTCRAEQWRNSGKRVFRITCAGAGSSENYVLGVGKSHAGTNTYLGGTDSFGFRPAGNLAHNFTIVNADHLPVGTPSVGVDYDIAVNFTDGKIHLGIDGTYYGNPETGANPAATFTAGTLLFPGISLFDTNCGTWALDVQPTGLPAGFTTWI